MVTEPVDRIVVIEALEHVGFSRHDDFFKFPCPAMPDDGAMLHSITMEIAKFVRFIVTDIFPDTRLPMIEAIEMQGAGSAGAVIVSLIPGRAAVAPLRHQRCRRAGNLGASFGAQHRRIGLTRACASAVERPYARPEANRGAVAPEPKESS
jgi:hypothetical protein